MSEKIDASRRCNQYDIQKHAEELNKKISMTSVMSNNNGLDDPRKILDFNFPIENFEEFLKFEKKLDPKDENNVMDPTSALQRQEALVRYVIYSKKIRLY